MRRRDILTALAAAGLSALALRRRGAPVPASSVSPHPGGRSLTARLATRSAICHVTPAPADRRSPPETAVFLPAGADPAGAPLAPYRAGWVAEDGSLVEVRAFASLEAAQESPREIEI